jgi:integrase/recombinase XerD
LRDIDKASINQLITNLSRQGLSAGSIAKYIAPLRALLSGAVDDGDLMINPALRLNINAKVGGEPRKARALTPAELDAVLAEIPDRQRLLFDVLAGTGCRVSEALGVSWEDLSERDGVIRLRFERHWYRGTMKSYTKTANGMRTIKLPPELGRRLWAQGADRTGPVFTTRDGKRLSSRYVVRVLEQAAKRAMVGHVRVHDFRHAHGSHLHDHGWPLTEIADRLGDDVETVSRTYAHKLKDSDRDLAFLDR